MTDRSTFPGKRPAVRLYFAQNPGGDTAGCVEWIRTTYGVKLRSKRVSTIRKQLDRTLTIPRGKTVTVPNDEKTETRKNQLSHAQFYRACEALKKHRQKFLDDRANRKDACRMLTELSGVPVGESSVGNVMEATGVTWEAKKAPPKNKKMRDMAIRTLVTACVRLYRKLDEEIPSALLDLYEEETGRRPQDVREGGEREDAMP